MSRRRAKSLKLDQVIDLLLDDTVSSESSDNDSVSQSPKKVEMKSTVKSEKATEKDLEEHSKKGSSDDTDDDDEDMPLWQLATKRKTPELPHKLSPSKVTLPDIKESKKIKSSSEDDEDDEDDDDDLPLWRLATKKKTPELLQKALPTKVVSSNEESDEDMDDDVPLAMIVKKSEPLKSNSNQLNVENNKHENKKGTFGLTKTVEQPETKLKIRNKKIASSLRGIYDFLDAESFRYKANAFDSDMSSSSETNEDSENHFDTADFKEHCFGAGEKRTKKLVAQSPAIKMDCMINNKYYISAKNLKRRKMFNN